MSGLVEIKRKAQAEQAGETAPGQLPVQPPVPRDIGAIHQEAAAYHARHEPPQARAAYWEQAVSDLQATAGQYSNDPLMLALLAAAFDDLEREYKRLPETNVAALEQSESIPPA